MSIDLLILRNRVKLERMIREDKEYSIILKQSQKLDKLINAKMKRLTQVSLFYIYIHIVVDVYIIVKEKIY